MVKEKQMTNYQFTIGETRNEEPKTKTGKVLMHLQREGSITSWDAIQLYRATRLSAIIYNLRDDGYDIESKRESDSDSNWTRYIYRGKIL
tara:strand:- start:2746 stop:3015 length:270 start_codon:yes stop_codon:yes gene_type:complete